MSTLTWITENELKRKITTKGKSFVGKITSKFYIGGEKVRNASGQQGEASDVKMSGSEKKVNGNKIFGEHIRHLLCVTRKFHFVVMKEKKTMAKKCTRKLCCTCNFFSR